jgi:hypothetical protein
LGRGLRELGRGLRDLTINLRNMIFMRKFKDVSVLSTMESLGIVLGEGGEAMEVDRVRVFWSVGPLVS